MWLVLWLVRTWGLVEVVQSRSSTAWHLRDGVHPTHCVDTCYMCMYARVHVAACVGVTLPD